MTGKRKRNDDSSENDSSENDSSDNDSSEDEFISGSDSEDHDELSNDIYEGESDINDDSSEDEPSKDEASENEFVEEISSEEDISCITQEILFKNVELSKINDKKINALDCLKRNAWYTRDIEEIINSITSECNCNIFIQHLKDYMISSIKYERTKRHRDQLLNL